MTLAAGEKLGPYEILAPIGAGGMGEVFRARDPRMGRDVAIKISAERFSERFEEEVRAIASLNHPNICTLHDVGPNYMVMELIEGPTLAERIKQGPIPLAESLNIARQIADALEAAHEKGIVHRDLKPRNVKTKPDGTVKVLDFGLARMGGTPTAKSEDSPTVSMEATQAGVILGTAGYMAPEQAKGKPVDKRADIWAFGVVLYEMLTGRRLFEGETVSETLAGVLKEQPDLNRVPAKVRPLLGRCLEKDPQKRLRDIGDMGLLLEGPAPAVAAQSRWLWPVFAALLFAAAAALAITHFRETPPLAYPMRFQIPLPDKGEFGNAFASNVVLSPDGHKLAFNTTGPDGGIWVRDLDSLDLRLLPGTQNAVAPSWSPDSRFLAFAARSQLKRVDVSGGPPQTLCDSPTQVGSSSWSREGLIIFGGPSPGVIRRVSEAGGVPTDVTALDPSRGETQHSQPTFLPDGRHFVYFRRSGVAERQGIFAGSLDVKPADQSRERLVATEFTGVWAPSADRRGGHLFFLRDGTLMAQPFDAGRLKLTGEPFPVAEQVGTTNINGFFSLSGNSILAYRTGTSVGNRQLAWFDRQGKQSGTAFEPAAYVSLSLSPDGTRAAIQRGSLANPDIWLHDFARGVSTRFTFDQNAVDMTGGKGPVWSPEGNRIAFSSRRGSFIDLFEKPSSGAGNEALLVHSDFSKVPDDWSRDGRFLLYTENNTNTSYDLMVLPLENDRKPIPLVNSMFAEAQGSFSPDTRWFAYISNESGRSEVYVQSFTPPGSGSAPAIGKWQISRDGGSRPKWRADGKEIIFRAPNGSPMAVDITTNPSFQAGAPKLLFTLPANVGSWDVTADGKRFLVAMPLQQQNTTTPITLVLNWEAGLKK